MKIKKENKNESSIIFLKMLLFFMPLPVYLLFTTYIFPAPNSAFIFLGIIGCFFVGIGLISIAGLLDGRYLGNVITGIILGVGLLPIVISSVIMYTPSIYSTIDENYLSFYFLIWLSFSISLIWYILFRFRISQVFRERGISKSRIDKMMNGAKNYWWYETICKTLNFMLIFWINKAFTILFLIGITVQLVLGWWRRIAPIVAIISCVLCILIVPMWIASFGTPLRTRRNEDNNNSIVVIMGIVFPIAQCFAIIKYLCGIFAK